MARPKMSREPVLQQAVSSQVKNMFSRGACVVLQALRTLNMEISALMVSKV